MTTTAPPRLAVAGCGYWGKNLVRSVHALGALAACCDANPALAGSMAEQYGVPAMDWAAVIADPDIAGVVIAAPAALQAVTAPTLQTVVAIDDATIRVGSPDGPVVPAASIGRIHGQGSAECRQACLRGEAAGA